MWIVELRRLGWLDFTERRSQTRASTLGKAEIFDEERT